MSFSGGDEFMVRGRFEDRTVTVRYREGTLEGDDDVVARVRRILDDRSTLRLTLQDDEHPATIEDPYAVMAAIQETVDIEAVEGDYPIPEADDSAS